MIPQEEHPSKFIDKDAADRIIRCGAEAEHLKDLHPDQLAIIHEKQWFKMFIPRAYGGLGFSLPQVLRTEEALSWADGSTAWVVTLCSGAGWFTGFLHDSLRSKILQQKNICVAGSGAVGGTANATDDGFEVTGRWKYASGSLHASVFTANCVIHHHGQLQVNNDGTPLVRAFLFEREEVTLHREWNAMGMIATGSHSFEVKELRVPHDRAFIIDPRHVKMNDVIFKYPFLQLAECTLSINLSGMCMRFLDLCADLFSKKAHRRPLSDGGGDLGELLSDATAEINACRAQYFSVIERSWRICDSGQSLSQEMAREVTGVSLRLAHKSRQVVDDLYPFCGLTAANQEQEINRVWRNIHTATQHEIFNFP